MVGRDGLTKSILFDKFEDCLAAAPQQIYSFYCNILLNSTVLSCISLHTAVVVIAQNS